jgi:hypothetical protein
MALNGLTSLMATFQPPTFSKPKKSKNKLEPTKHSGFFFFVGEQRPILLEEHPEMKGTFKVAKELGKRWHRLGEEGQKYYTDFAEGHHCGYYYQKSKSDWKKQGETKFHQASLLTSVSSTSQHGA